MLSTRIVNYFERLRRRNRWDWLIAFGLNNRILNRRVFSIPLEELSIPNLNLGTVNFYSRDIFEFMGCDSIHSYQRLPYQHSKIIEYFASMSLLNVRSGSIILDAAGGSSAEYLRAVNQHVGGINGIIQDPYASPEIGSMFKVIHGSIDTIPLPNDSIDAISCHHSIEHFRDDLDTRFVLEAIRVLKPGGKLVIVPMFLTNVYSETWNNHSSHDTAQADLEAVQLFDRSATFAGWGPFEGFARTYDQAALERRILNPIAHQCTATVYRVQVDGKPAPDLKRNRHQPKLNADMKVLLLEKH